MNQLVRQVRFDTNTLNALNRALVGFDNLFTDFEQHFANSVASNYPPYNILKHDKDTYEVQIAVTGFDPKEITVEIDQNQLIVRGEVDGKENENVQYIHRGLAGRNFTRVLPLAEHIEVGEARIKNGVLSIELNRVVPEALKPRLLKIKSE
jgi:molecular chaperone IbpA